MKLSPGIRNFWLVIGSQVGIALVLGLLAGPLAVAVLTLASLPIYLQLRRVKTSILKAVPSHWVYQPVTIESLESADLDWMQQTTQALEQLGFQRLRDYGIAGSSGFARSLVHPQHYCFAEIGQTFTPAGGLVYHCAIFSDLTPDWSLANINRAVQQTDSLAYLWRHPRWLKRLTPCTNLADFLQEHLQFRQQMIQDLGIHVATEISWDAYEAMMQRGIENIQHCLRTKPLLVGMVEATLFELKPAAEWLGEYPQRSRRRQKFPLARGD